ncbi:polysaccharide biosynthesis protein [Polaribacter gangjinensis]|uniref:Polysaccharide biosynthesis protein n=1 Tax=Polaribacter gangjinensis TaxID=574710 RepID=A0A2S7W9B9_9FLAO|nr:nucleoside-diphosphate sugar epimerase/dehydratase [Polaribacter gangjinensis]PQJ73812.1 polysaccharide biosynthesis protein [Polaribacter gangjinensis]
MLRILFLRTVNKYASKWLVLAIDLFLVCVSFFFAYAIRYNASFEFDLQHLLLQIPFVLVLACIAFALVGSYKGIVRHTGTKDAFNVFLGISIHTIFIGFALLVNGLLAIFPTFSIPISIIIIHFLLANFMMIISRFIFKAMFELVNTQVKTITNILIYGAGDSGMITYAAINRDRKNNYEIIGFLDDNPNKVNKKIDRIKIYNPDKIDAEFIEKHDIKEVIFSMPRLRSGRLLELTDKFLELNVKVKTVPTLTKWIEGDLQANQIKNVNIDDLLDRDQIEIVNPIVMSKVSGKVLLVTGAAGSIGSEIARQLTAYNPKKLILVDQSESALYDLQQEFVQLGLSNFVALVSDVRDLKRMERIFIKYQPEQVFHAAAYKHVPLMEKTPYEAIKINIMGTKHMADLSIQFGIERFVMVSTDKAVNPTNVMGATKRIAELYISCLSHAQSNTKFTITRFGNVLGSNGSVIPLFKKQIEKGGPLTVTHKEITRYFMTIPEACSLVLEAGTMGKGGEIYIFDMGKSVKIFDIAKRMIYLSGLKYPGDIDIKITGLRPGEKLYEELLADGENTTKTYHEKILIAKTNQIDFVVTKGKIEDILLELPSVNNKKLVSLMKEIVPEYISKNSEFEELDHEVSNELMN